MVTIRKDMLVSMVAQDTGLSTYQVRSVLDSLLASVALSLSKGRKVTIGDFGSFSPQKRAARTGRNPHTGEAVPIPPRTVARFTPGKLMEKSVSGLKMFGGGRK